MEDHYATNGYHRSGRQRLEEIERKREIVFFFCVSWRAKQVLVEITVEETLALVKALATPISRRKATNLPAADRN